jgi:hypothetical protein
MSAAATPARGLPRGERRRPIRAEDASDRRGTPRRAFERRAMPMGPGALVGRLLVEPEPELTCKVWDLGQGGTCVFIQQDVQLATNLPVRLDLKCSYEAVIFPFSAVVATFVGLADLSSDASRCKGWAGPLPWFEYHLRPDAPCPRRILAPLPWRRYWMAAVLGS